MKVLAKLILFIAWFVSMMYGFYLIVVTATLVGQGYMLLVFIQMALSSYGMYRVLFKKGE